MSWPANMAALGAVLASTSIAETKTMPIPVTTADAIARLAPLAQCRKSPRVAAVQTEMVRENLQEMIDNSRRIAERSMQVAGRSGGDYDRPPMSGPGSMLVQGWSGRHG
jgi:hypothetical protein